MGQKKSAAKPADEFQMTVKVTPEGIRTAYARLDEAKQQLREQARRELVTLTQEISRRSEYASEEEAFADIEDARNEAYQARKHKP